MKKQENITDIERYARVYAEIDLDAIAENMDAMKKNINAETKMIAVIKADGYGHGAVPIAGILEEKEYLFGFAVATLEEALILRKAGVKKAILILGFTFPYAYADIIAYEIRPAVFKYETAEQLSAEAVRQNKTVYVHLKVDTGMGRIGYLPNRQSAEEIKRIAKLPNLVLEGIFTHFAKADEKVKDSANEQIEKFLAFLEMLSMEGIEFELKHCSNSAGILELPRANLDVVRAGITMYGLYPSEQVSKNAVPLKPALALKSHIVYIKEVEAGTGISYGSDYITQKPMRIATIPVGYGDGYPRSLTNKGYVLICGKKARILGRICMDQFMADVTEIPEAKEYDEVVLVGKSQNSRITAEELGALSGRFNYEFVCDLGKRIPRVYIKNGSIAGSKNYYDDYDGGISR